MKNVSMTKRIALVGVMASLTFAGSWIQIPLIAESRLHLGNVMCLLSAFILGPVYGGLAAGIGSGAFDLTNPLYVPTAPFTFVFKFMLAFVCGLIAWRKGKNAEDIKTNVVAGIAGIMTYIILYLTRNIIVDLYFKNIALELTIANALYRLLFSTINGVIAVMASVPLAKAVKSALRQSNFL